MDPVRIDGSRGEGGGQILRSSLALSLATGKPLRIEGIRAGRKKGGLLRQHLACVGLAKQIGQADVAGDELRSQTLTFAPTVCSGGAYTARVGSAGSTALVVQSVLPALLTLDAPTTLHIEGGTHARSAPAFEFLRDVFAPAVRRMGAQVSLRIERHGFFPAGGGRIVVEVAPAECWQPLEILERGGRVRAFATILSAQLPDVVPDRMARAIKKRMTWSPKDIRTVRVTDSVSPGGSVILTFEHRGITEVFVEHAAQGVPSEVVVKRAARRAQNWMAAEAPVGLFLADQLLLPMALTRGGRFVAQGITEHTQTNIGVIEAFLGPCIEVGPPSEGGREIVVRGRLDATP